MSHFLKVKQLSRQSHTVIRLHITSHRSHPQALNSSLLETNWTTTHEKLFHSTTLHQCTCSSHYDTIKYMLSLDRLCVCMLVKRAMT